MKDKQTVDVYSAKALLGEIRALDNLRKDIASKVSPSIEVVYGLLDHAKSKAESMLHLAWTNEPDEPDQIEIAEIDLRGGCEALRDTLQILWVEMLALENHGHMAKPERVKQLLNHAFEMLNTIDPASADEDEEEPN